MSQLKIGDAVEINDNRFVEGLGGMVTAVKDNGRCEVYIQGEPAIIHKDNLTKTKDQNSQIDKWTFNIDEERLWDFSLFEKKENAIAEGKEVAKSRSLNRFYIGKTKEPVFNAIDVDSILERAWESLSSEVGIDLADKWYENINSKDVSRLEEMLCDTFEKWKIETNNVPKCYAITEFEKIEV